jgi:hypothetical protein
MYKGHQVDGVRNGRREPPGKPSRSLLETAKRQLHLDFTGREVVSVTTARTRVQRRT